MNAEKQYERLLKKYELKLTSCALTDEIREMVKFKLKKKSLLKNNTNVLNNISYFNRL
jgi:hypothetical protein